jgi:hypothetical protein
MNSALGGAGVARTYDATSRRVGAWGLRPGTVIGPCRLDPDTSKRAGGAGHG